MSVEFLQSLQRGRYPDLNAPNFQEGAGGKGQACLKSRVALGLGQGWPLGVLGRMT